jgi:hypothetical protein
VLAPLKPCYVSAVTRGVASEPVQVAGSGFTPNSRVTLTIDGATAATDVAVDGGGNLAGATVPAPLQERGQRAFTLTATEQDDASVTASASSLVTAVRVTARPRVARPTQRIRLAGRGFTQSGPVWGHYYQGRRLRRTVRLAAHPAGPCGTFAVRRRQFPFFPSRGLWLLQVDQQRRWEPSPPTGWFTLRISVQVTPGP